MWVLKDKELLIVRFSNFILYIIFKGGLVWLVNNL